MQKNVMIIMIGIFLLLVPVSGWPGWLAMESQPCLNITGRVRQPLSLTMKDLENFKSHTVQLNEITGDRNFQGAFHYQGVPLKVLLELSGIRKEKGVDFFKPTDAAIIVKNQAGQQIVLSWGEVFYRSSEAVIIAFSASPIIPGKDCGSCHTPDVFKRWYDPLKRPIGFPKLIVTQDFFTDRSLESVTTIEVTMVPCGRLIKKVKPLFSPRFALFEEGKEKKGNFNFFVLPHKRVFGKILGEGRGFHGITEFEGVSLRDLLMQSGVTFDKNMVIVVSAPDGYRSLLSGGELFLNPLGERVIVADKINRSPFEKEGKFQLIIPDDLFADRWVKAMDTIEVFSLTQLKTKDD